jgi:hypothetical protein
VAGKFNDDPSTCRVVDIAEVSPNGRLGAADDSWGCSRPLDDSVAVKRASRAPQVAVGLPNPTEDDVGTSAGNTGGVSAEGADECTPKVKEGTAPAVVTAVDCRFDGEGVNGDATSPPGVFTLKVLPKGEGDMTLSTGDVCTVGKPAGDIGGESRRLDGPGERNDADDHGGDREPPWGPITE